jgi:hypothetical protein
VSIQIERSSPDEYDIRLSIEDLQFLIAALHAGPVAYLTRHLQALDLTTIESNERISIAPLIEIRRVSDGYAVVMDDRLARVVVHGARNYLASSIASAELRRARRFANELRAAFAATLPTRDWTAEGGTLRRVSASQPSGTAQLEMDPIAFDVICALLSGGNWRQRVLMSDQASREVADLLSKRVWIDDLISRQYAMSRALADSQIEIIERTPLLRISIKEPTVIVILQAIEVAIRSVTDDERDAIFGYSSEMVSSVLEAYRNASAVQSRVD